MRVSDKQFVTEYLNRIGYCGDGAICPGTLIELQRLHVFSVPFENLDLLSDSFKPNLEKEFLFNKVVRCRRGGVCYELNTLFYYLLTAMGFSAHQVSGAVQPGENMFSHVATLVSFEDGSYLADVGFGDAYLPVLKIGETPSARYNNYEYTLVPLDEGVYDIMYTRHGEESVRMYTFALTPRAMADYFGRFDWASAKGNTIFSQYPICVFHAPGRRITLRSGKLIIVRDDQVIETRPVASGQETNDVLREYFNLA